jgi:hypothetical protein
VIAYLVQFRGVGADIKPRFRRVMGTSHGTAVEAALRSLRPGALTRYARGHPKMAAHVCQADAPKHATGVPFRVHSYELLLGLPEETSR